MKVYLLICFYVFIIASSVESNNLKYQNGQYLSSNLHKDLAKLAGEGNSNNLNRYSEREKNYNLVRSKTNNLNLVNAENYLLPNNLLRVGNSIDLNAENNNFLGYNLHNVDRQRNSKNLYRLKSEKSNLSPDNLVSVSRQGTPGFGNPESTDLQSTETVTLYSDHNLDAVIEKYLGNPVLEQDGVTKPSDVPQFESRFGFPGWGGYGGGGFGGGTGIGGGISTVVGIGASIGAGAFGYGGMGGHGYGGMGGHGYVGMGGHGYVGGGYRNPGAGVFGYPGFGK